jgi:long-chain fatty acid transport protein
MRKLLIFIAAVLISGNLLAGGLVTNTNQSAMFTRLQNRNASTDIDAVYYNPAGVTRLGTGFFVSVNNQTITQTQKVISTNEFLTGQPKEYIGNVSAPLFPGVYVAYNTGKLSLSAGFNPIGGGGGAEYKTGLPSFEMNVANIPPMLTGQGIPTSSYSADIYFKGTSVYFGYQVNVAYKINDMLSVAAGVRLVSAKNTYSGYLKNISINPNYPRFGVAYTGGLVPASQFFTDGQNYLNAVSTQLSGTATSLQPIITGGGGEVLLSDGTAVGLTPVQVATLEGTVSALGGDPTNMTIAQSQAFFSGASTTYGENAATMGGYAIATQDAKVDATQSGTGITPIISVNFAPSDKLNIGIKYEFKTDLNLKTKVAPNMGGGVFTDGVTVIADMPAMLSIGVSYKPIEKLMLVGNFATYFDKNVDYDGSESIQIDQIDKNFFEYGIGLEYGLTDKLRVSGGWTHTDTGVNLNYQSDQSFSTNTNSFGAGFGYRISPMIDLNLGGQYTSYKDGSKAFQDIIDHTYTETYKKSTWIVALGVDFYFGKK